MSVVAHLVVCPVCDRPVVQHDPDTARWCYRAWLARDARGSADRRRVDALERRWCFVPEPSPLLAQLEAAGEWDDAT